MVVVAVAVVGWLLGVGGVGGGRGLGDWFGFGLGVVVGVVGVVGVVVGVVGVVGVVDVVDVEDLFPMNQHDEYQNDVDGGVLGVN